MAQLGWVNNELHLTFPDATHDVLHWGAVPGANAYEVQESESETFATGVTTHTVNILEYTHTVSDKQIFLRVRAIDTTNANTPSNWSYTIVTRRTATVAPPPPPPPPVGEIWEGQRVIETKTPKTLHHFFGRDVRKVSFDDETHVECITDAEFNRRMLQWDDVFVKVIDGEIIYSPIQFE